MQIALGVLIRSMQQILLLSLGAIILKSEIFNSWLWVALNYLHLQPNWFPLILAEKKSTRILVVHALLFLINILTYFEFSNLKFNLT